MTGMQLYVKFMITMAVGLAGIGVMLKTLLDTLFAEWDPVHDARRWWRHVSHHRPERSRVSAEEILEELEGRRRGLPQPAPARTIERRRNVLRSVAEAEDRLASPEAVEAL
jgi:hypothetical protein